MLTQSASPLTILRHPVQHMLLAALQQRPDHCQGVFGGPSARLISQAATDREPEAASILEHSHPQSMGLFYASSNGHQPDLTLVRKIAASLQMGLPAYLILLALDTEGRMEAHAFHITHDSLLPVELLLAEDHALYDTQANG